MSEITCRRTKWRKGDGTIEYNPGYYYLDRGPFKSREKAEEYKAQKDWERKEESGENRIEQLERTVEYLESRIRALEEKN